MSVERGVRAQAESDKQPYHPLASRLLSEAHAQVHAIDQQAFPQWRFTPEWEDVCEAAFLSLVHLRLVISGCLEVVRATCATVVGEGLEPPRWPLVGGGLVGAPVETLRLACACVASDVQDCDAVWDCAVRAYIEVLGHIHNGARREVSRLEQRVQEIEDAIRQGRDHGETRDTFGTRL